MTRRRRNRVTRTGARLPGEPEAAARPRTRAQQATQQDSPRGRRSTTTPVQQPPARPRSAAVQEHSSVGQIDPQTIRRPESAFGLYCTHQKQQDPNVTIGDLRQEWLDMAQPRREEWIQRSLETKQRYEQSLRDYHQQTQ
ncbi:hypothetical protein BC940DRAFT_295650 [Gongronella butleri]|nr:hypothetical protein BC940DRAFT_295650 [Gongronella butleri]